MREVLAIFNPQARRGDNASREAALKELLSRPAQGASNPIRLSWKTTSHPEHAIQLAEAARRYDTVLAVGGDGTINEVINGLMRIEKERRPVFGALPAGTGNDFTTNVGLPKDLTQAARLLALGTTRHIDIGEVQGNSRVRYFGNTLGLGFSGTATEVAHHSRSFLRGILMYLYVVLKTILLHPHSLDVTMTIDDVHHNKRAISMLNICNGPTEGGGFPVAPDAVMDDGLFSYVITRRLNRLQMLRYIPVILQEKHVLHPDTFQFGEAQTFHIRSQQPLTVQVDGELFAPPGRLHHIDVKLHSQALEVLCGA